MKKNAMYHDERDRHDDAAAVRDFQERYGGVAAEAIPGTGVRRFRAIIFRYYRKNKRDFPWRRTIDPYRITVSEVMLQQTQAARAAEKFVEFIRAFPTIRALSRAPLNRVLEVWQGMGYNRRARYLRDLARQVAAEYHGRIPDDPAVLERLPGIGKATAASIAAFAYNRPTLFIETNIRAVFLHFFFHGHAGVSDREIMPIVAATLDRKNPRDWYSALMDYGAMLKKRHPNPSRKSAHHQQQKPFEGSRRQLRGLVLRTLLAKPGITVQRLSTIIGRPEDLVESVVDNLVSEGLIGRKGNLLHV